MHTEIYYVNLHGSRIGAMGTYQTVAASGKRNERVVHITTYIIEGASDCFLKSHVPRSASTTQLVDFGFVSQLKRRASRPRYLRLQRRYRIHLDHPATGGLFDSALLSDPATNGWIQNRLTHLTHRNCPSLFCVERKLRKSGLRAQS